MSKNCNCEMTHQTFHAVIFRLNLALTISFLTKKTVTEIYNTYIGLFQNKNDFLIQAALPFMRHFCVRSITGAEMSKTLWYWCQSISRTLRHWWNWKCLRYEVSVHPATLYLFTVESNPLSTCSDKYFC